MTSSDIPTFFSCVEVYPTGDEYISNQQIKKSIKRSRSNLSKGQIRAALQKSKQWPSQIDTITVKFLGGAKWQHAWVEKVVKENVEPHIGIKFIFSQSHVNPYITISFKPGSAYSYIGVDCLRKKTEETMNIGFMDCPGDQSGGEFEWKDVVYIVPPNVHRNNNIIGGTIIHEFGHALGLIHEHQNPTGTKIHWNDSRVLEFYSGPPNNWNKQQIKHNILNKYNTTQLNTTKFDPKSVMLYPVNSWLTTDGYETEANFKLSSLDKKLLSTIYPKNNKPKEPVELKPSPQVVPEDIIAEEELDEIEEIPEEEIPEEENNLFNFDFNENRYIIYTIIIIILLLLLIQML